MNLAFWLSIVLAAASCSGLVLAGRGRWQGWAVGLATQPVWAWFAIVTKSYGLLLVGVMYTTVYTKNLIKWRKEAAIVQRIESGVRQGFISVNDARRFHGMEKLDSFDG